MTNDEMRMLVARCGAANDQLDAAFEEYVQNLGPRGLYEAAVYAAQMIDDIEKQARVENGVSQLVTLLYIAENYARQRAQAMAEQYVREKCK